MKFNNTSGLALLNFTPLYSKSKKRVMTRKSIRSFGQEALKLKTGRIIFSMVTVSPTLEIISSAGL